VEEDSLMGWKFFTASGQLKGIGPAGAAGADGEAGEAGEAGAPGAAGADGADAVGHFLFASRPRVETGLGRRMYAPMDGTILNVYAWCDTVVPSGKTVRLDVTKGGTSIYPTATKPTIEAGNRLGPDRVPDTTSFSKGDVFRVQVVNTGTLSDRIFLAIVYEGA
jgi:hypothetical protein